MSNGGHPLLEQAQPFNWRCVRIDHVEALQEAVLGAGLDAVQLSRGQMTGGLAFAAADGMVFSTGQIDGHVSLTGPLSETMTTLGVGINIPPGSRHWMRAVETGGVGIFRAGDTHEAIYKPGTIYACVTLGDDRLEAIAADMDLVLDAKQLGGSRIDGQLLSPEPLAVLQRAFVGLHRAGAERSGDAPALAGVMLESLVRHVAREPRSVPASQNTGTYNRIVARARAYITEHLTGPLSISAIARASFASQSTLYRAFHEVLDETPQSFIRKLRLNRIRRDLASEEEATCTIATLANRWGMGELGRFAGWYRDLFGELPSRTRAKCVSDSRDGARRLRRTA